MSSIIDIFNLIFYQPLLQALILLYKYLPGHDFGVAVIALTVLIKLALYPLGVKGIRSQKALQELQPRIKEIQNRLKDDKAKQTKEVMELYKKEKVNPFSGLLLLLVQLPILFALFRVFSKGFEGMGEINTTFFGFMDLADKSTILVILAGLAQFWQAKTQAPASIPLRGTSAGKPSAPDFSSMMQKQMLYFFPLFTVFILWKMPAAIALYWLVTTLFTIGQQYIILKKKKENVAG